MEASFLIVGVGKKFLKRLAQPSVCYLRTVTSNGQVIWDAIIVNGGFPKRDMDVCFIEGRVQAQDLSNGRDIYIPSIFKNRAQTKSINRTEAFIIETPYDDRLIPDMRRT